jgi:hypothetical protein
MLRERKASTETLVMPLNRWDARPAAHTTNAMSKKFESTLSQLITKHTTLYDAFHLQKPAKQIQVDLIFECPPWPTADSLA